VAILVRRLSKPKSPHSKIQTKSIVKSEPSKYATISKTAQINPMVGKKIVAQEIKKR